MLMSNVDLWEIIKIEGKDRVIVTAKNISKGKLIAIMYGGVIFLSKEGNSVDNGSTIRHERR